jgi:hypothetical protein
MDFVPVPAEDEDDESRAAAAAAAVAENFWLMMGIGMDDSQPNISTCILVSSRMCVTVLDLHLFLTLVLTSDQPLYSPIYFFKSGPWEIPRREILNGEEKKGKILTLKKKAK